MPRPLPFIAARGLSRVEASRYIGVSPSTFDKLVVDGTVPQPKHIRARKVWDRHQLDAAFDRLEGDDEERNEWDEPNEWDEVLKPDASLARGEATGRRRRKSTG